MSSGEAEYYGVTKGAAQGMNIQETIRDLGVDNKIIIWTDATAAKGIAQRRGLGKVRHIQTKELWLQEKIANEEITIMKVKGENNPADALTKDVDQTKLRTHMEKLGISTTTGVDVDHENGRNE